MTDLHIVTVATSKEYYFNYLIESCKRNGNNLEILGFGQVWKGYGWKLSLMLDYLKNKNELDIVCFVDGYDVICNRNLNELKNQFIEYKNKYDFKLIVGVDIYKFKPQELIAHIYFNDCNDILLNSGTYIGYAKDIYDILYETINDNDLNDINDDQILLTKYCRKHPNDIYFDKNQNFFLTMHKSFYEINDELTIYNNEAYYKNKKPFFIHGPSCTYLNLLIHNLNYKIDNIESDKIKYNLKKYFIQKLIYHSTTFVKRFLYIIILLIFLILLYKN